MNSRTPGSAQHPQHHPQSDLLNLEFAMGFTATPRGARLARRLVSHRLDEHGYPYASRVNKEVTLLAGELAANAVRHGRVPGRDFHLRLIEVEAEAGTGAAPAPYAMLRLEVTDTRGEELPVFREPAADEERGRGLVVVKTLADRWGVETRAEAAPGKTVWAEYWLSPDP